MTDKWYVDVATTVTVTINDDKVYKALYDLYEKIKTPGEAASCLAYLAAVSGCTRLNELDGWEEWPETAASIHFGEYPQIMQVVGA